ncbi:MAG TPA: class II aldolase/adducin family protein [Steroidobacteraceae bacterium]|jgi:ribulose-5-phosphate 4-epimerase/fuculose-1-phosphate aldolase
MSDEAARWARSGGAAVQELRQARIDLAAACRMAARLDWQEAVANHFSMAISADGRQFLMNPLWRHFSRMRASDFVVLDAQAATPADTATVDPTAWAIHGSMHAQLSRARCILHVHPPHATAWSCLADPHIPPIDQTSARFYKRVAIDTEYGGLADNAAEGLRLTRALADKSVLMMGNHGVVVVGDTIAAAFDTLYHLERACRTLLLAHASGQPLRVLPDAIAEQTALGWEQDGAQPAEHFEQIKAVLDAEDNSYRN